MEPSIDPGKDGGRISSVTVDVFAYDAAFGVGTWWDDDSTVRAETRTAPERVIVISGNPGGLTSLARHLLTLAQAAVPDGSHLDFDMDYWYEDDSPVLRVQVVKDLR